MCLYIYMAKMTSIYTNLVDPSQLLQEINPRTQSELCNTFTDQRQSLLELCTLVPP